jgi:hypothetical protein
MGLVVLYIALLAQTTVDHLDRLTPDWTGLSRTIPFFAYAAILIIVFGASATHILLSGDSIKRYHTPFPFQKRLVIPVLEIEQVLFWQTGLQVLTTYGLGLQTKTGRQVLYQFFRSREEVMREVKKLADALGDRGLTTVKVAETRAAVANRSFGNPWMIGAGLLLFFVFYRLARF